jgi:hypothetical protein
MEMAQNVTTQQAAEDSVRKYGRLPDDYLRVNAFLHQIGNDLPPMAIRHHGRGFPGRKKTWRCRDQRSKENGSSAFSATIQS